MRTRYVSVIALLSALGTILPGSGAAGATATARRVFPFIADDYARAVAEARARKVPLFIESWAPW
jgi:hypothetical protein